MHPRTLLIVPYGIETCTADFGYLGARLLIVPYGIETCRRSNTFNSINLLIVPYGIETRNFLLRRFHLCIF